MKKKSEEIKKRAIIISAILIILLIILVFFFIHKYLLTKNKINKMFEEIREVEPDTEFDSGLFSSLKDACLEKEIGEVCNVFSEGESKKGICKLSENNETVCMIV